MTFLPQELQPTPEDVEALIAEYKQFHASPELSLQEFETSRKIRERAERLELAEGVSREIVTIGETGTVVILRHGEGPTIAYRADIDALPLEEKTGLDYASTVTGEVDGETVPVMHGCGHDTHIAMGLKTMDIFARNADHWAGTIEFIFQPAEEGKDGAKLMVNQGLWEKVAVPEVLYGQHVYSLKAGEILVTENELTASVDSLKITLKGRGGHGSQPQDTVDPVMLSAYVLVRLQSVISREISPLEPAVVTCGYLHAGKKENIIPDQAELRLSVRSSTEDVRHRLLDRIERIVTAECEASGAEPPVIENFHASRIVDNDPKLSHSLAQAFAEELGEDRVTFDPEFRMMGSEDFAELVADEGVPYSYWLVGGHSQETLDAEEPISNHSPFFAPLPDPTLEAGVRAATTALYLHLKR